MVLLYTLFQHKREKRKLITTSNITKLTTIYESNDEYDTIDNKHISMPGSENYRDKYNQDQNQSHTSEQSDKSEHSRSDEPIKPIWESHQEYIQN